MYQVWIEGYLREGSKQNACVACWRSSKAQPQAGRSARAGGLGEGVALVYMQYSRWDIQLIARFQAFL